MFCHFVNNFVAVMRDYGRQTGKGFDFLNKAYGFLLGTTKGGIIATILFILVAFLMFVLFLKMSVIESYKRIEKGQEVAFCKVEAAQLDNAPLYFAITMNTLITIFTFVWGVIR